MNTEDNAFPILDERDQKIADLTEVVDKLARFIDYLLDDKDNEDSFVEQKLSEILALSSDKAHLENLVYSLLEKLDKYRSLAIKSEDNVDLREPGWLDL